MTVQHMTNDKFVLHSLHCNTIYRYCIFVIVQNNHLIRLLPHEDNMSNYNNVSANNKMQKVAIITGSSSGIGKTTAIAVAKEGIRVVVAARRDKEGEETLRLIKESGGEGMFVKTDVSNEDSVIAVVQETVNMYGRLDYAFNNAGVVEDPAPFTNKTSNIFDKIMAINVKGVYLSMKHEIPQILKNGGSAIVNTSSVYGVIGNPQLPIYVASKHAILGLTKAAALEYAKAGIRINAVAPGAIETEMMEQSIGNDKQLRQALVALHPTGRAGKPEEIANAVVWLLSDKATFVTNYIYAGAMPNFPVL
jgi:NAD(P)-dependent dehydrogenase (short-subunit alcohol dehydrogenase family)